MGLERFRDIVAEDEFSLAEAFLEFAKAERPDVESDDYLVALDELGEGASSALTGVAPDERLDALTRFLVAEGFAGDTEDYYDDANSFLDLVLERRRGIPITLSVVWIEVGLRAGVPMVGIGMPMHFLVGLAGTSRFADAFHGRAISADEAMLLFGRLTQGEVEWRDEFLAAVSAGDIVRRALTNLKAVYGTRGDLRRALWVEDHLLAIPGTPARELVERATVLEALQRFRDAIADLRRYAEHEPEHVDAITARIRRLQAAMN